MQFKYVVDLDVNEYNKMSLLTNHALNITNDFKHH